MTVYEKYLSVFTTSNNSIYFDDFTIEWMPDDAELEGGESVIISELDIPADTVIENDNPATDKNSGKDNANTESSATGDNSRPMLFIVLGLLSALGLIAVYYFEIRKRRQNND